MIFIKNLFVSLILLNLTSLLIFGQSVRITSKMVTYTRPKPASSLKKTFTVNYPIVKARSLRLSNKIQDSISYRSVLSFSLEDEMGEYQWLEEADFEVGYNKRGVLSIYLNFTGIGAYESYFGKNAVIDLKTGKRMTAKDVFRNFNGLLKQIKKLQKIEIAESTKEIKEQKDFGEVNTEELFRFVDFKKIHLENFSVNADGVTFQYDYSFPRIFMMIEPGGNYFLSWKEIKPFIKKDGLLGRFIK